MATTEHLERQVPTVPGTLEGIYENHLERYRFANTLLTGGTVVDVGCGVGYGSLLLDRAAAYIGADRDRDAIDYAKEHYDADHRAWVCGDIAVADPGETGWANAVLLLEVIEHVPRDRWDCVVSQCRELLCSGGVFVLSCPAGPEGVASPRPFHEYEPGEAELVTLLSEWFDSVEIYYQAIGDPAILQERPQADRWEVIAVCR